MLIGGGEHARVVAAAARSSGWHVAGYVAVARNAESEALADLKYLGSDRVALEIGGCLTLAVGAQHARPGIVARLGEGAKWGNVVHGTAWVAESAQLAEGVQVLARSVVNVGAQLGRHVLINTGAIIEHDCRLEEFVQIAPGVVMGGGTVIGAGSSIGLGATIRDHVRIGRNVRVAMGAVVVADVPDDDVVAGVPARSRPDLRSMGPT